MGETPELMETLKRTAGIDGHELLRAQQYALERGILLEEALVELDIANREQLGECLAHVMGLPHVPLLSSQPAPEARAMLSAACARSWGVTPRVYDPREQLLTLAVHSLDQIAEMERLRHFFMQPHDLAFTVASKPEIDEANLACYGPPTPHEEMARPSATAGPRWRPPPIPDSAAAAELRSMPGRAVAGQPATEPAAQQAAKGQEAPHEPQDERYDEMGRALHGAVSLAVNMAFAEDPERLGAVRARVRYSRLLATRLGLPRDQRDASVIAAWLSAFEDNPERIRRIETPYNVEEIIFPKRQAGARLRIEALLLRLVTYYQALQEADPKAAEDVSLTRRALRSAWSGAPEDQSILETFLQVLMDEAFLSKLDRSSGRVLIVDAEEAQAAKLAPPLATDGYDVVVAGDTEQAEAELARAAPDVILMSASASSQGAEFLCRRVKSSAEYRDIPVIVVLRPGATARPADFLRAGADDVLSGPLDLELLLLKVHRLLVATPTAGSPKGVHGSLADMSLTDMIQIVCAGGRTMEITLTAAGKKAQVLVEGGDVVHAALDDAEGEEAFYALMKWADAEFLALPCDAPPTRTIHIPTMSLLMEGARLADEGTNA